MSEKTQSAASRLKDRARRTAGELAGEFMGLARALFQNPELSGEETASARLLAEALERSGFEVETGAGGLPTAFVARSRRAGRPVLAFLAEYDALPEIGHGCGHNLIGAAAVGAAMVLARTAGDLEGQVRVIGTPAEETLGGKVVLVRNGIFSDVDAALMVHPGHEDRVLVDSLACESLEVAYAGKPAHAVAHPEKGINALDALIALFNARDALLRQCPPGMRLVGIIAEGGVRPDMIPERAVGQFSIRAPCRRLVRGAAEAFRRRATALAEAYGCEVRIRELDLPYEEMVTNVALADAYRENLRALGVRVNDGSRENMGSLDMGSVSYEVPSLHPFFAMVPPTVASHTREFADATLSAAGRAGLLRCVQALAMTGIDFLVAPDLRDRAAEEHRRFRQTLEAAGGAMRTVLPAVSPGDRVVVVAPAGPVDQERLQRGMERLTEMGLQPVRGPASGRVTGYLAGTDDERSRDLSHAFLQGPAGGVFYARGGYGTTRILPHLDLEAMAASGRLLVGYSDATALGLALSVKRPFPFLHGPSVADLGAERPDHDGDSLRAGLFGSHPGGRQRLGDLETLSGGSARGVVLGGCLSVLCALVGTPFMPSLAGRILFLEDVNEEPYRLDRMLTQLLQTGRLAGVAGLLLGQFTGCVPRDATRPSRTAREVLAEIAGRLQVPVLAGLPAGHGAGRVTIPLGVDVEIDGDGGVAVFHHR